MLSILLFCTIPSPARLLRAYHLSSLSFAQVLLQTENQVQNRLLQAQHIRTPGIFQVDDDMLIAPEDIQLAFHIWKGDMDRMVGFQGRRHYYDGKSTFVIYLAAS